MGSHLREERVIDAVDAVCRWALSRRALLSGGATAWGARVGHRRDAVDTNTLSRRRLSEGVIDAAWSLERIHRDQNRPGIRINQIHAEAVLDIVQYRRLL